jgi:hypothetical protein
MNKNKTDGHAQQDGNSLAYSLGILSLGILSGYVGKRMLTSASGMSKAPPSGMKRAIIGMASKAGFVPHSAFPMRSMPVDSSALVPTDFTTGISEATRQDIPGGKYGVPVFNRTNTEISMV